MTSEHSHPRCVGAGALLLAVTLLGLGCTIAAQPSLSPQQPPLSAPLQPGAASDAQPSPSGAAAQCPISVQYNVNLGQGQDTAQVPIFVATVTVSNNDAQNVGLNVLADAACPTCTSKLHSATSPSWLLGIPCASFQLQVTVSSWRMGWQFPFGSTIKSKGDVFDPSIVLLVPDSTTPVIETAPPSGPGPDTHAIAPGKSLQIGFLGTKGNGESSTETHAGVHCSVNHMFLAKLVTSLFCCLLTEQSH